MSPAVSVTNANLALQRRNTLTITCYSVKPEPRTGFNRRVVFVFGNPFFHGTAYNSTTQLLSYLRVLAGRSAYTWICTHLISECGQLSRALSDGYKSTTFRQNAKVGLRPTSKTSPDGHFVRACAQSNGQLTKLVGLSGCR